jgi:hypothetical protein
MSAERRKQLFDGPSELESEANVILCQSQGDPSMQKSNPSKRSRISRDFRFYPLQCHFWSLSIKTRPCSQWTFRVLLLLVVVISSFYPVPLINGAGGFVCSQKSTSCSRGPLRPHGDSNGLPVVGAAGAHGHHHPEGCCCCGMSIQWHSSDCDLRGWNQVYLGLNIWEMKTWYNLITSDI